MSQAATPKAESVSAPMRAFMVSIHRQRLVVRQFEAMGVDSCTVSVQHEDLCDRDAGERVHVMGLESWRGLDAWQQQRREEAALRLQYRLNDRQDVINRSTP